MEWLTRLPVIGPLIARLMRTHAWRTYEHLDEVRWTRLAAAITFTSFVALFPLITVGAAVTAALLSPSQEHDLTRKLSQQVPGIADKLDISALVANAGTVGLIGGVLLIFTGAGWVGSLRECLRVVWGKKEDPGNPIVRKLADIGVLIGLGLMMLLSLAVSGFASAAVDRVADAAGIAHASAARPLLAAVAFVIAVAADFLILGYMLTGLPRVSPDRRALVVASLVGAVGLEILKLALSGYLQGVAAKSMYGAFGVPIALLLWINFMAKLLLYCAAWTAVPRRDMVARDAAWVDGPDTPADPPAQTPRTESADADTDAGADPDDGGSHRAAA
jgi:membrane protein